MLCSNSGSMIMVIFLLLIFGAVCMLIQKISNLMYILSFVEKDVKMACSMMRNIIDLEKSFDDTNPTFNKIQIPENKKTISISPKNLKHYPYQPSISSLIEVSSNDDDSDSDCAYESDDDYNDLNINYSECGDDKCEKMVKNVHMSLDLDKLEDINVKLLREVSGSDEKNVEVEVEVDVEVDELDSDLKNVSNELKEEFKEESKEVNVHEEKELNFNQKKKEHKENYKKMNLPELRKYVIDHKLNIDASKMKKPELLKAIELKENVVEELKENAVEELEENAVEELEEVEVIL